MLKEISDKSFNQFQEKLKEVKKVSVLYQDQKKEIYNLFEKVDRLKNHIIALDEVGYYSLILTLSVSGITLIDNLKKLSI